MTTLRSHGKVLALLLGVAVVTLLRSYAAFRHPTLHYEDGALLAYCADRPGPAGIFRFYAGYLSLGPNLVAYLASLFPIHSVPYVMGACSLGVTSLALAALSLERFRFVIPGDGERRALVGLLAALPLGDFALHSVTVYSIWHLLWLLILFSAAPAPRGVIGATAQTALLGVAAWSHPLAVVCLPVCAVAFLRRRSLSDRASSASLLTLIAAYLLLGIQWRALPSGLGGAAALGAALEYLSQRVVFETLFGAVLRHELHVRGHALLIHVVSVAAVIAGVCLLRRRASCGGTAWLLPAAAGLLAVGITWLVAATRFDAVDDGLGAWEQRYFQVQRLLLVSAGWMLASPLLARLGRRWRVAAIVAVLAWTVGLNLADRACFASSVEEGRRVEAFLADVARQERHREAGLPYASPLVLDRGGYWDIRIDLDR